MVHRPGLVHNGVMQSTQDLSESRLADAWAELESHSNQGYTLHPDAYRLAFADPEFLLRRETRGLRMQLEMLKPEVDQHAQGIENTIVVFGSARFAPPEQAEKALAAAQAETGDFVAAEKTAQQGRKAAAAANDAAWSEKLTQWSQQFAQKKPIRD